jgi:phosphorylcholine metabolism protein LicD
MDLKDILKSGLSKELIQKLKLNNNVNNFIKGKGDISNNVISQIGDELGYKLRMIMVADERVEIKSHNVLAYNEQFKKDLESLDKVAQEEAKKKLIEKEKISKNSKSNQSKVITECNNAEEETIETDFLTIDLDLGL